MPTPVAKLRPEHLEALFRARLDSGVSPATIGHLRAVLRTALAQAEKWGVIARNVAALTEAPRVTRHEIAPLTPEETRQLLATAAGDRLEALYVVAVTTGLRQGELLALRWTDVDLEQSLLTVRATLQKGQEGFVFAEPKTTRSRRVVMLSNTATAALRRHRLMQAEERLRLGAAWADPDLVFATTVGSPIDASNLVTSGFRPLLSRAGLRQIRFHDLRHTAATLLLGREVHPKVVSDMLGHSQIAVTLDTYSHVSPTMQREAVAAFDLIIGTDAIG